MGYAYVFFKYERSVNEALDYQNHTIERKKVIWIH